LETSSEMPLRRISCLAALSANALYIISVTVGIKHFSTQAASIPFITGIEVQHNQIRVQFPSLLNRFFSVLCFSADLKVRFAFEYLTERMADKRIVIYDQDLRHRQTPWARVVLAFDAKLSFAA